MLCFGEVLWDCLPRGLFAGGAPVNVAYHLQRLGLPAIPVTAVGDDFLGRELLRRFDRWGLTREGVHVVREKETGAVLVQLDEHGGATYDILQDVAWDWIKLEESLRPRAARAAALVYGSLAQRADHNRRQLIRLKEWAPQARRIFDVNLRPPFDAPEVVWRLCEGADLIKLNHDELAKLMSREHDLKAVESVARDFAKRTGGARICVTAGGDGAGLWWDGDWFWEPARPIEVEDTIGAGDSFLAGLLKGWLLDGKEPASILAGACRLSEFVAGREGAMPDYRIGSDGSIQTA